MPATHCTGAKRVSGDAWDQEMGIERWLCGSCSCVYVTWVGRKVQHECRIYCGFRGCTQHPVIESGRPFYCDGCRCNASTESGERCSMPAHHGVICGVHQKAMHAA